LSRTAQTLAFGWDAEQIRAQYPHLSLAQIHAALAYYYDHQPELDARIAQTLRETDTLRGALPESPAVARLRGAGRAP
jgi:hypothetical protein